MSQLLLSFSSRDCRIVNFYKIFKFSVVTYVFINTLVFAVNRKPEIDIIYYLQRFKEGWRDGKWEERIEFRDCIEDTGFKKVAGQITFCQCLWVIVI